MKILILPFKGINVSTLMYVTKMTNLSKNNLTKPFYQLWLDFNFKDVVILI